MRFVVTNNHSPILLANKKGAFHSEARFFDQGSHPENQFAAHQVDPDNRRRESSVSATFSCMNARVTNG